MSYRTIDVRTCQGMSTIWLNRPEVRNAFNDAVIAELISAFSAAEADASVRVVSVAGHGKAFCAGGDVNWMKKMAQLGPEENRDGAVAMATMLNRLYSLRKPTIARVHGAAFAGGLGLVAACDIAIASADAEFCISEVRLGLIPATISPYALAAMGERAAHRYFLTAERFGALEAYRLGLVHEVVEADALDERVDEIRHQLVQGGPIAHAATKELIRSMSRRTIAADLVADTAARISGAWGSEEGKEGIRSFLKKEAPAWRQLSQ